MHIRNVNDVVRGRLGRSERGPEKMLDKKNEQRYTSTILKALMFLDFLGQTHRFHANRRDSVLKISKRRVNRLKFPQGNRSAEIKMLKGHRCPLKAGEFGF